MNKYLIVWKNLNKNSYYFKILKHNYNNYYVGYINEYNHVCIIFDDISNYLIITKQYFNLKRKIIRCLISFLEKI